MRPGASARAGSVVGDATSPSRCRCPAPGAAHGQRAADENEPVPPAARAVAGEAGGEVPTVIVLDHAVPAPRRGSASTVALGERHGDRRAGQAGDVKVGASAVPLQIRFAPQVTARRPGSRTTVDAPARPPSAIEPKLSVSSPVDGVTVSVLRISAVTVARRQWRPKRSKRSRPWREPGRQQCSGESISFSYTPSKRELAAGPHCPPDGNHCPLDAANRASPIQTWSVKLVNGCAFFLRD